MKDLIYICAQPTDKYFAWQVGLWLQSLQDIGEDDKAHVVLFSPKEERVIAREWDKLQEVFPKTKFKVYKDEANIAHLMRAYIPVLRPYVLSRYFLENKELTEKVVFYCDSDVLFTRKPDLNQYIEDDVCYLSDTVSYIGADYILNKKNDVIKDKKKEFDKKDVLGDMARFVGVDKQVVINNKLDSGGAQYLLKNVDGNFWAKVMKDCIVLKVYLDGINKEFFESGDMGFQSWCADMWSVLYNIWARGGKTKVVKEMDFAWSTDKVEKLDVVSIFHNAGITSDSKMRTTQKGPDGKNIEVEAPAFYKGMFKDGDNPYEALNYLNKVAAHEVSKQYCTAYYVNYMLKHRDKLYFR